MNLEQFFVMALASESTALSQIAISTAQSTNRDSSGGYIDLALAKLVAVTKMMHYHQCKFDVRVDISNLVAPEALVADIHQHIVSIYMRLGDLVHGGVVNLAPQQTGSVDLGCELALAGQYPM